MKWRKNHPDDPAVQAVYPEKRKTCLSGASNTPPGRVAGQISAVLVEMKHGKVGV